MALSPLMKVAALGSAMAMSVSQPALACAVCASAKNEENQFAYLATTGFLTFLPLLFAAGVMLWIRHRAREAAIANGELDDNVVPMANQESQ